MIELKGFGQNIDMVEFEKLMIKNHIDDKIIEITNAIFLLDKNKMLVDERLFLEVQFLNKLKDRLRFNPEFIEQTISQNSELILKNMELQGKIDELMKLL
jgi:hypothetical protein